ncbi:DMT family transporter [Sphingomonas fennica]|uniref:EamA family transporter n=1 Tax=Edaphosphingomonas fennica TaxID=114404 RepID=A0A2T4I5N9_9SPHN|nr:DMT family transporter [Sphingomonas fennica]PTD25643.1 EamA family transporter [Sphingomonas fennica]
MSEAPLSPATQARVFLPLAVVTLVWSSTWLVIRDQIALVPPTWSVAYRFAVGAMAMMAYAAVTKQTLRLTREGWRMAIAVGITQFVLNFNFVYRAEHYVTSGLVAVVFALLVVPNAILGRIFLGQGLSGRFVAGSVVAGLGIAMLFIHELAAGGAGQAAVAAGIGFTLMAIMSASTANVLQATETAKRQPMVAVLAWAMAIGSGLNMLIALATVGPPTFDPRPAYALGTLYLGVIGSALTFPLYFGVVRAIGPARAAYSSVVIPVLAMGLSTIFEGYRWSALPAAGGLLTLAGLVIALKARSPAR